MSQDINSIIKQLAEIDSASAKILQKTQDENCLLYTSDAADDTR